jgi:YD repeat-containing protein
MSPAGVAVADDGTVYITDNSSVGLGERRIDKVHQDEVLTVVAGKGTGQLSDGIAAANAAIDPEAIALMHDGGLVVADRLVNRVRIIGPPLPGPGSSDTVADLLIASEDGAQVFVFDRLGRHLRTVDAVTAVTLLRFGYDAQGRVESLIDRDGNQTRVERDAAGAPTAIVAPFGQRTALALNSKGLLQAIVDPAGGSVAMTYASGLLETYTDARGGVHRFTFDADGRLVKDENPAGGALSLTRTPTTTGFNADVATALGRITSHQVDFTRSGATTWTDTDPAGVRTTTSQDELGNWSIDY